jgi:hypothetical protein
MARAMRKGSSWAWSNLPAFADIDAAKNLIDQVIEDIDAASVPAPRQLGPVVVVGSEPPFCIATQQPGVWVHWVVEAPCCALPQGRPPAERSGSFVLVAIGPLGKYLTISCRYLSHTCAYCRLSLKDVLWLAIVSGSGEVLQ